MGRGEGQSQLLDEGWHAEIRTLRGSGGRAERHELRFRGDRGVARGEEGFQASPYRRGALAGGREPARGARGILLRPLKVGASIGSVRAALAWRGRGAVEVERREDHRNKIRDEDGGEATGAFAVQSSGSSELVGRRVLSCQGGAAIPLPPGAPSPRAASPQHAENQQKMRQRTKPDPQRHTFTPHGKQYTRPTSHHPRSTAGSDAGAARAARPPPRGRQGRAPQRHHHRPSAVVGQEHRRQFSLRPDQKF